jgi:uncharacterized membrane protein YccC
MRKVLLGGTIGALPGATIILVTALLHETGLITSDQSQIAFIGVPILFAGVLVGTLSGGAGRTALGVATGFVVGMTVGMLLTPATFPGLWLITTPAAMIAGGALAARPDDGNRSPHGGLGHGPRPRHA